MHVEFGYRAVEEQYQPSRLLKFVTAAEKIGFQFICVADHFHPWFHEGGCAGHAWVWIGAAAAFTKQIRLGTGVTTPIYRYHPAIIAQAFATLDEMFPGRIYLGLGTGEAMNEMPFGLRWPSFRERAERLEEAVTIIKSLWNEGFLSFKGKHFVLRDTRLYTKPKAEIPIYIAASGPTVARMAGRFGDALMTSASVARDPDARLKLFTAFAEGAEESGRDPERITKMVEMKISYDEDYDKALNALARWRSALIPNIIAKPILDPRELDRLSETVDKKKMENSVCTSMEQCIKIVEELIGFGFNEVQVGSSSPDEEGFIRKFGGEALPYLKERYST